MILTACIFTYDLNTPLGMSVSLLYLIPFSLSGLFARRRFALAFAGVTTALVASPAKKYWIIKPPGSVPCSASDIMIYYCLVQDTGRAP
jgi:hypothetical protein